MYEIVKNVKYFRCGDFYTVGDNTTTSVDGITDQSFNGEIVIEERIKGKRVIEISQYAFQSCSIKRVTIYAKIRSINLRAFRYCTKLEYINIPSTVTFIGHTALLLGESGVTFDLDATIEFNTGREENIFIEINNFANRKTFFVIYPSTFVPDYFEITGAFNGATTAHICAPSVFDFFTKQTITDASKCPVPQYRERYNSCNICRTCRAKRDQSHLLISILITIATRI